MPTIETTPKLIQNLKSEAKALASDFTALFAYVISKHEFSDKMLLELTGSLSDPDLREDAKTVLLMYVNSGREFYFDAECALVDHIVRGNEKSAETAKEVLFKYIEENDLWFQTLKKLARFLKNEKTTEIAKTILLEYVAVPCESSETPHDLNTNDCGDEKHVDTKVVALLSDSNRHIAENAKEVLLKLVSQRGTLSGWAEDDLIKLLKSKTQWVRFAAKEILLRYRWHLDLCPFIELLKNKEAAEAAKEILLHRAKREKLDRYDQSSLLALIADGDEDIAKVAQEIFLGYIHTIGDLYEDIYEDMTKRVYGWSHNKRIAEVIAKLRDNADEDDAEASDDE